MTDDAERWKEKYLKSIDRQDKLERRWLARLDLLRQGLVRSSLAAEGADRAVDQCMKEMREVVRTDDIDAGLASLIPRLEKAVLDSEQRREARLEQMSTSLTSLIAQLQTLQLPREVARPLKRLAKGVDERVTQAVELPLLLNELSQLQGKALQSLGTTEALPKPGLLERLFGSRPSDEQVAAGGPGAPASEALVAPAAPQASAGSTTDHEIQPKLDTPPLHTAIEVASPLAAESPPASPIAPTAAEPEIVPASVVDDTQAPAAETEVTAPVTAPERVTVEQTVDEAPAIEDPIQPQVAADADEVTDHEPVEASTEAAEDTLTLVDTVAEDSAYALPASPEPSYSSVATHIEQTLTGLLDDLELPDHYRAQADDMRQRLENGLNWYELLPILDDLAVLMLAVNNNGHLEFQSYLKQLDERLDSFQSHLQAASAGHADNQSAAHELDSQLRQQVGGLQDSVQGATDLTTLRNVLDSRLEGLIVTMDAHRHQRDQREQEVAMRLQALSERVTSMEREARTAQVSLEEQRQKALVDALTGLPNRAAWNKRLESEIAQLQVAHGSLLLGILDLDHFKRINDSYGHLAGDKVLKIIATELRKRLRDSDFIARFGGEEFVLLLPDTALAAGLDLLEVLRTAIERCPFHFKGEPVTITVSFGLTPFRPGERADMVLKRADQALYRAKSGGRNRIEHA